MLEIWTFYEAGCNSIALKQLKSIRIFQMSSRSLKFYSKHRICAIESRNVLEHWTNPRLSQNENKKSSPEPSRNSIQFNTVWGSVTLESKYNVTVWTFWLSCSHTEWVVLSFYRADIEISWLLMNLQNAEFRGAQAQEAPDGSPIHPSILRLVPRPREVNSQYRGFGNSISCISNECL